MMRQKEIAAKLSVAIKYLVSCVYLSACNSGQLPVGASVKLSPSEHKVATVVNNPNEPPVCLTDENGSYQDLPILISVTDTSGTPMGNAEVLLYSDYSGNTFTGPDVIQIFADTNGNGVVDADTELVSGIDSDAYKTITDQYNGTAMVFVRMNLTCPYSGSLKAFVGSSVAQAQLEVFLTYAVGTVEPAGKLQ